jgi:hypothetical protein
MQLPLSLKSIFSVALIVIGAALHFFSTHSGNQELGVITALCLVGVAGALISAVIPTAKRGRNISDFGFFFSLTVFVGGLARLNAEIFNPDLEIYQNYSDATTLFELSAFHSYLDFDELSLLTDTGGAIFLWSALYALIEGLGFEATPSVGVLMNASIVALTCVVTVTGAEKLFGGIDRRVDVVRYLLATSGIVLMFGGMHLRDGFLMLFNSLILLLLTSWRTGMSVTAMLRIIGSGAILVGIMTLFRHESMFIFYGLFGAILAERFLASTSKLKIIGLIILVAISLLATALLFDHYSGLMDHTKGLYGDELNIEGSLGYKLIYDAPIPIRIGVGISYMIAASVPVWGGFLYQEWYYWFVGIQAVQALIVLPLFLISLQMIVFGTFGIDPLSSRLRIIAMLYLTMGVVVSMSTLGLRHLGQFVPLLYVLAAHGSSHQSARLLTMIAASVLVSVSLIWGLAKYA